ncbi:hypothetical protein [Paraliomyxa miuraensis]|uniref:hypothetical protein n=1 Tax=Paraliomyxa miuraensis TaxID=376150 RepID=UPI00225A5121|nr:hypothetical protein [Paraliomyxa miuraensis]MCX4247688.1 hypothetical protein [Paraliomyxa miuraensis]
MIPCPACDRFVLPDARRCPFCDTGLRSAPPPLGSSIAGVILGLTLSACGGDSTGDEGAETVAGSTTMATEDPGMTNTSMVSTTSMASTTTGPPDAEASVAAYGGPDVDTLPPDEDTADADTATGETGSGTGTESGSGTGTTGTSGG